jgi:hypothetical protein
LTFHHYPILSYIFFSFPTFSYLVTQRLHDISSVSKATNKSAANTHSLSCYLDILPSLLSPSPIFTYQHTAAHQTTTVPPNQQSPPPPPPHLN